MLIFRCCYGWLLVYRVGTGHGIYSLACSWPLGQPPPLGFGEWCCYESAWTNVSSGPASSSLGVYLSGNCWILWELHVYCFQALTEPLSIGATSAAVHQGSSCLASSPPLAVLWFSFLNNKHLKGGKWSSISFSFSCTYYANVLLLRYTHPQPSLLFWLVFS